MRPSYAQQFSPMQSSTISERLHLAMHLLMEYLIARRPAEMSGIKLRPRIVSWHDVAGASSWAAAVLRVEEKGQGPLDSYQDAAASLATAGTARRRANLILGTARSRAAARQFQARNPGIILGKLWRWRWNHACSCKRSRPQ